MCDDVTPDEDDGLVEGRVRGRRSLLVGAVMLAVVATLPVVVRAFGGDEALRLARPAPTPGASGTGPPVAAPGLHGRIVYTTFETRGTAERQQRLVVLDLELGTATLGPLVPSVEELTVGGEDGRTPVLVADDAGAQGIVFVVPDLSADAAPVEVARGDVLSLSADGRALLVGTTAPAAAGEGCSDRAFALSTVALAPGGVRALLAGVAGCGSLVSGVLDGDTAVVSVADGRSVTVETAGAAGPPLFRGLAVVSRSPRGTFVLADLEGGVLRGLGVWPRTPTGPLLAWPGAGAPRPLVRDVRLFGQRVLAWSRDGSHVVVNGIVGDERGMWLVYVPAGTMQPLLPPGSFPLRSAFSGATFDDRGTAFAGAPGVIVAATDEGVYPVTLPPGAPTPVGPVAWLP
ncbi:MAG: hypothetical protein ACXWXK_04820 [Actinomycetota bacterium]